jgi:hypothetical protein
MNEVAKHKERPVDNFDSFDDSVQTVDGSNNNRAGRLVGTQLKFTNEVTWETAEDADVSGKNFLAVNIRRTEVKWGDGVPVEVIELGPNDKFRDLDLVNQAVPQSEWREGPDGRMQGPWQRQLVVELLDVKTMATFSWPTATVGGAVAVRELVERVQRMRRFRGEHVYPYVKLDHKHMRTRFGGRERPHLEILAWYRIAERGVEAVDTTPRLALDKAPAQQPLPSTAPLQPVSEPSREEELDDKIPW